MSFTPKRRRADSKVEVHKSLIANRKLTSGTSSISNHGLGSPIKNSRVSREKTFSKAIYVSRLKPDVTEQSIASYLKNSVSGLDESKFDLRLLLKKDQDVQRLNFISFRLSCNNDLFDKFIDPSFWPSHVLIGEFVEKRKSASVNDFLPKSSTQTSFPTAPHQSPNLVSPTENPSLGHQIQSLTSPMEVFQSPTQ